MSQKNQQQRPKYGLYIPPKETVVPAVKTSNIFGNDEETDQQKSSALLAKKPMGNPFSLVKKREFEKVQEEALSEDPNAFLYDEVVHAPARNNHVQIRGPSEPKKPKYMENLMRMAEERKALNEVTRVRMAKKEAAIDADLYKDKEIFLTAGYKKKLEEMKDKLKAESWKDEEDVTKQADMSAFYSNLLKGNVAFGAGKGGRMREQQNHSRTEPHIKRLGLNTNGTIQDSPKESEEEEHFGPIRRK